MTEQEKKELQERVKSVIERVNNAAVQAGRDPSEITLVAATKMNDAERVQAAIEAGIRVCGENRVQELQEKYEQNAYDGADLQFIGTLQTNKVKYLIGKVSLIQSVGSVHLGEAIAKEAEARCLSGYSSGGKYRQRSRKKRSSGRRTARCNRKIERKKVASYPRIDGNSSRCG